MKLYFTSLGTRQKIIFLVTLVVMALIVGAGIIFNPKPKSAQHSFSINMTIKEIAPKLKVTGKTIARELELPLNIAKNKPLKMLGVSQQSLVECVEHLKSHKPTFLKYYLFGALVLFAFVFLTYLGRPENAEIKDRKSWYPRTLHIVSLIVAVVVCGFMLGKSPNPMEGAVKVFKSFVGLYPSVSEKVMFFGLFLFLAIIGNKLICGWACPFGALQELFYQLPILRKMKQRKLPFIVTNIIRGVLFVAMLLLLFGIVGGRKGFVLYHNLNPFNLFNLHFEQLAILLTTVIALFLALFIYRPFCHLICPFGFVSWLAERISFVRVRVDLNKCVKCGACEKACPVEAITGKLQQKTFAADCYSCGRCLNSCPQDAIHYCSICKKFTEKK